MIRIIVIAAILSNKGIENASKPKSR